MYVCIAIAKCAYNRVRYRFIIINVDEITNKHWTLVINPFCILTIRK